MTSRLNPYIGFSGNARQAMEFYRDVFGGDLRINTFGEYGQADSAEADKIMHAQLETDNGFTLMASDGPPGTEVTVGDNISISLSGDDTEVLTRCWNGLAEGASIIEPLTEAPWGDTFGMLTDRFGINWMVNIGPSA